jgi:hypothetical protein
MRCSVKDSILKMGSVKMDPGPIDYKTAIPVPGIEG